MVDDQRQAEVEAGLDERIRRARQDLFETVAPRTPEVGRVRSRVRREGVAVGAVAAALVLAWSAAQFSSDQPAERVATDTITSPPTSDDGNLGLSVEDRRYALEVEPEEPLASWLDAPACEELHAKTGGELRRLASSGATGLTPACWSEREEVVSYFGVLYVPAGMSIMTDTDDAVMAAGGLSIRVNTGNRDPLLPEEVDPANEGTSWRFAEVAGTKAVVHRLTETESAVTWLVDSGDGVTTEIALHGARPPAELLDLAQRIEVGVPADTASGPDPGTAAPLTTAPAGSSSTTVAAPAADAGEPAVWTVNEGDPPQEESQTFRARVNALRCGPNTEVLEPTLAFHEDEVVVTFTVASLPPGNYTCVGQGVVEYVVDLGEPIGDRDLVDGTCRMTGGTGGSYCVAGATRWRHDAP